VEFIRDVGRAETGGLALPWLAPKASSRGAEKEVLQKVVTVSCGERSLADSATNGRIGLARLAFHPDDFVERVAVGAMESVISHSFSYVTEPRGIVKKRTHNRDRLVPLPRDTAEDT
jgi:hypothetical protein